MRKKDEDEEERERHRNDLNRSISRQDIIKIALVCVVVASCLSIASNNEHKMYDVIGNSWTDILTRLSWRFFGGEQAVIIDLDQDGGEIDDYYQQGLIDDPYNLFDPFAAANADVVASPFPSREFGATKDENDQLVPPLINFYSPTPSPSPSPSKSPSSSHSASITRSPSETPSFTPTLPITPSATPSLTSHLCVPSSVPTATPSSSQTSKPTIMKFRLSSPHLTPSATKTPVPVVISFDDDSKYLPDDFFNDLGQNPS